LVQVDGGVDTTTVSVAAAYGANVVVAGTAIFGAPNPGEAISALRVVVEKATRVGI